MNYSPLDFCLLIPCFNNREGLLHSLQTVYYSNPHYLIVIVDDGSKEALAEENISIATHHPFVILRSEKNEGITKALNKGLRWIYDNTETRYIARLDCGDRCVPHRFDKQVNFLKEHPDTGLIASWCRFESGDKKHGYTYSTPCTHEQIKKSLYLRNVFIHPTIVFETALAKEAGDYPLDFELVEDYAFCWKLSLLKKTYIINEILVISEWSETGISQKNRGKQLKMRWKVVRLFENKTYRKVIAFLLITALFLLPDRLTLYMKKVWHK